MTYIKIKDRAAIDVTQKSSGDLCEDFESLFNIYFKYLDKSRWKNFIRQRYGLDNGIAYNLQEMGRSYNFTRERARQISFLIHHQFGKFLNGKELHKPRIFLNPENYSFKDFERELSDQRVLTLNQAFDLFKKFLKKNRPHLKNYLNFLMAIYGYTLHFKKFKHAKIDFYYKDFNYEDLIEKAKVIRFFLCNNSKPHSIKFLSKKFDLSEKELIFFQVFLPEIVVSMQSGNIFYQMSQKNSLCKDIENILRSNGKSMYYKEVKAQLLKMGYKKEGVPWNINSCLSRSDTVVSLGKSGLWALKEWNLNTATIFDIIKGVLTKSGRPLKNKEIHKAANKIRTVLPHTITSLLNLYKDVFVHYKEGTYGLKEWNLKKPLWNIRTYNKGNPPFKQQKMFKDALYFLKKHGGSIGLRLLIDQMIEKDPTYKPSSIYGILNKNKKYFEKTKQRGCVGRIISLKKSTIGIVVQKF